jgi:2-hydroxy-3-keto-5-methylthiopentenyl-1-phosphate phosphatase
MSLKKPKAAKPQTLHPNLAVLCDFDGTITTTDTFEYIVKKYAQGDWRRFDQEYEKGQITLQECIRKQGALVRAPEMVLIAEMERVTGFRPNFDKLVAYCRGNRIPLGIVSAGVDFVIKHLLRMKGWNNIVKLYVAKAQNTSEGIKFTFPRLRDKTSLSIKDDMVRFHKGRGRRVAYAGDGIWDIHALKLADYPFAIKGSRLAGLCRQQNIPAREITDFQEMVTALQYDLSSEMSRPRSSSP